MDDIFDGLQKYGLEKVIEKSHEIFAPEPQVEKPKPEKKARQLNIDSFIYEKTYVCPVCAFNFKSYALRHGRVQLKSVDFDLRPTYTFIEPLLYDVIICEGCGYASVSEVFEKITKRESELVLLEITPHYRPVPYPKEPTIEMAIDRYKLALLNAVVRKGKEGLKAYICMKLTWLYRIKGEEYLNERKFASLTLTGFTSALSKEDTPILGISEGAVQYVIAAFSTFLGDKQSALKILSNLIVSKSTTTRLKNRAIDLKNTINTLKNKGM